MGNLTSNDNELSRILAKLWNDTILPLYKMGKIQTERLLQAYLFMLLKNRFEEKVPNDWDVWIEPQFYLTPDASLGGKMYKPDIVITRDQDIAGIIELKFSPQEWNPEKNREAAKADVEKLILYKEGISVYTRTDPLGELFLLELLPDQGSYNDTKVYQRAKNTLYFFLGIAHYTKDVATELTLQGKDTFKEEFVCLLHITDPHRKKAKS